MIRKSVGFACLVLFISAGFIQAAHAGDVGSVYGKVVDARTGSPVYEALVRLCLDGKCMMTQTSSDGSYIFATFPAGKGLKLTVRKAGYETYKGKIAELLGGSIVTKNVKLQRRAPGPDHGFITGTVYDENGDPLAGVRVLISGHLIWTDEDGEYSRRLLPGDYTIRAIARGFENYIVFNIEVWTGQTTVHDIHLVPLPWVFPGAFQWGDSGACDGIVGPDDLAVIQSVLLGGAGDYHGCIPDSKLIQDLDGDNIIGPVDYNILRNWTLGLFDQTQGRANELNLLSPASFSQAAAGSVVDLTAQVMSNHMFYVTRVGWGVVFEIDEAATTCPTASLFGRPYPVTWHYGKEYFEAGPSTFDYTDLNGEVAIPLDTVDCLPGDVITVNVFVPSDDEAGVPWGDRFPVTLDAPSPFVVEIQ